MHHDARDLNVGQWEKPCGNQTAPRCKPSALGSPGSPGDRDAVSGIDSEGQGPGEMAGLLDQVMLVAPVNCCLEVCIERTAVQLHQVQDGSCQGFHDLLCERKGSEGKVTRPQQAPSCSHGAD